MFDGNVLYAAAAYNAGPKAVASWIRGKDVDADLWVARIPYDETRVRGEGRGQPRAVSVPARSPIALAMNAATVRIERARVRHDPPRGSPPSGAVIAGVLALAPVAGRRREGAEAEGRVRLPRAGAAALPRAAHVREARPGPRLSSLAHSLKVALKYRRQRGRLRRRPSMNPSGAATHAKGVKFFGHALQVHEKIAPALACVEKRLKKELHRQPSLHCRSAGGLRTTNTVPRRRGVKPPAPASRSTSTPTTRSRAAAASIHGRRARSAKGPGQDRLSARIRALKCWIQLARALRLRLARSRPEVGDTMHFEFLGDPSSTSRVDQRRRM